MLREEENEDENIETQPSTIPELPLVIKGDVSGTVEAVVSSLQGLPSNKVRLNVIHSSVGAITESDVDLAAAAQGMLFGFNIKYDKRVQAHARASNVKIVTQTVIYRLIEEAKKQLVALLPKVYEPKVNGEARILQLFSINIKGRQYANVAGCRVTNGVIKRGEKVRVLRGQHTVFDGQLETLKNVKKDIDEAGKGLECGMSFIDFQDFQPDDIVQSYVMIEKEQTL
jgi:translation initiation factor IF-2